MLKTEDELSRNFSMNMNSRPIINDITLSRDMHRCEIVESHEMSPLGPMETNQEKKQSSSTQDSGIIYSDGATNQVVDLDKMFR